MDFKKYFFALSIEGRQVFAKKVNSTVGHLTNCAYGYAPMNTAVCVSVEDETFGIVSRKELRPQDYERHWPDLRKNTKPPARNSIKKRITADKRVD